MGAGYRLVHTIREREQKAWESVPNHLPEQRIMGGLRLPHNRAREKRWVTNCRITKARTAVATRYFFCTRFDPGE